MAEEVGIEEEEEPMVFDEVEAVALGLTPPPSSSDPQTLPSESLVQTPTSDPANPIPANIWRERVFPRRFSTRTTVPFPTPSVARWLNWRKSLRKPIILPNPSPFTMTCSGDSTTSHHFLAAGSSPAATPGIEEDEEDEVNGGRERG